MTKPLKHVTCVGSGLIGQGWATLFAARGCEVILQDVSDDRLKRGAARSDRSGGRKGRQRVL